MAGTLFVVATPIGNLEDLSPRARRVLSEVDLIAAEDTRRTARLLAHCAIHRPVVSLHAHNEAREAPRLVSRLLAGASIALVSDAGTPGVSDPGMLLVREARKRGVRVSPVPGPSAVMAALSASGLPADRFLFMGFPPRSGAARREWMRQIAGSTMTVVAFEAPHRIRRTLEEAHNSVQRPISVYREITKTFEELVEYTSNDASGDIKELGEFVLVVSGAKQASGDVGLDTVRAADLFLCMTENCSIDDEEAYRLVARAWSIDDRALRTAVKKERIRRKQAARETDS